MTLLRRGAALLCALALAACSSSGTKNQPQDLGPNPGLLPLQAVWRVRLPAPVVQAGGIRVQGEHVLIASQDGSVTTLDAHSGAQQARFSVAQGISAGVGSDAERQAVVTRGNQLIVYQQGQPQWQRSLPAAAYTAPLLAGERVFVLTADRALSAFDAASGQPLWSAQHPGDPLVLRQQGVLLAVGNTLVVGLSARLSGVDPDTGAVRWQAPLASPRGTNDVERLADLVGAASRVGPSVCARAFAASVGCVDTTSASVRWMHPAQGAQGIAGNAHAVYAAESNGTVIAWERRDGKRLWSHTLLQHRQLTAPLLWGDALVLGDGSGLLHLLSAADGQPLERLNTDSSGIATPPALATDTLIVATRNGTVYGFRRK